MNVVSTQVFHLNMGTSEQGLDDGEDIGNFYRKLYSKDKAAESDSPRATLSEVARSLVTLCCTMNEYPYVRYSKAQTGPGIAAQHFQV